MPTQHILDLIVWFPGERRHVPIFHHQDRDRLAAVDFTGKLGFCQIAAEGFEIRVLAEDLGDVKSSCSVEEQQQGETESKNRRESERHILKIDHQMMSSHLRRR